jgi:uncharacterized protein (DUF1684 family)
MSINWNGVNCSLKKINFFTRIKFCFNSPLITTEWQWRAVLRFSFNFPYMSKRKFNNQWEAFVAALKNYSLSGTLTCQGWRRTHHTFTAANKSEKIACDVMNLLNGNGILRERRLMLELLDYWDIHKDH